MADLPAIESVTVGAIYAAYEANRREEWFGNIGMSAFGNECDRSLWYDWRKAAPPEQLDGRKLRLFETGHREEERLVADLKHQAGIPVQDRDPATGKQFKVTCLGGHVSGRLDGRAFGIPEAPKTEHVVEVKTHNEKSFKALVKSGVEKSKPGHFAQMTFYMHLSGLTRALYVACNKNDEAIYTERVEYDPAQAIALVARAERIVAAVSPPMRLHEDPTSKAAFACGWCPARSLCHAGEFARRHCRTCLHATPVVGDGDASLWRCERLKADLTPQAQAVGCALHLYIPGLVPGEQVDADLDAETVTYALTNGTTWVDGDRP